MLQSIVFGVSCALVAVSIGIIIKVFLGKFPVRYSKFTRRGDGKGKGVIV